MPPRKKNSDATASKPAEATRRSTRTSKKSTPIPSDLSGDELSSQQPALRGSSTKSTTSNNTQQDEAAQEITVRTTRAKSYTSSRPSTANSEAASQSHPLRIVSAPVTKKDVQMLDVNAAKEEDELAGEGPALKKAKPSAKEAPSTRKGRSKYDNPEEMLTNPRAPLGTAKLRDLLCSNKAWDILDAEEKKSVLSKFPDLIEVLDAGTENARPNIAALKNNDNFRHDVARYQEDLRKGWHDPEWIRQAQAAHRKREVGAYNEYLSARFQDEWGMPMPGLYDSQEANWGSSMDGGEGEQPEVKTSVRKQESDVSKDGEGTDPDAMTGIEITTQGNDGGRPGEEEPEKADDQKEEQIHPQDVPMAQD
ncbi:Asx homology domain-containing protein [Hypoxylon sp. FL1857]|nr:Asx homology domain-containing protein [Hypoxylon sp. FL1857]